MPRVEDDRVWLRLNFDKGPPYYAEMKTETTQTMKVMGQDVTQTQTQTFYLQWTPEGRKPNGDAVLRLRIVGAKMMIDLGGVRIDLDSTIKKHDANPILPFFEKLMTADLRFIIDTRTMTIKDIEGRDELIKNLGQPNTSLEPIFAQMLSKDAMIQWTEPPYFSFVPTNPVRNGDTWERTHTFDLGPVGTYRSVTQYTFDRQAENRARILVKNNLHYEVPKDKAGLNFQIKQADLTSTDGAGEITFDLAKGRLVESTLRQALAGTLTIEVGGLVTPVVLDQRQTARIWVTEKNPLARRD
jgi:hypothetical protein